MKEMIEPPTNLTGGHPSMPPPVNQPATPAVNIAGGAGGFDLVKFKQYLHIIIKRIWLVAICFVVALVLGVIKTSGEQAIYRSWTYLLLSRGTPLPEQMRFREAELLGDVMDTQQRIIQSGNVMSRAREKLNRPAAEINLLLKSVSASSVARSAMIGIKVDSLDPKFSADFANAIAEAYLEFKSDQRLASSQSTAVTLTQQANKIREELKKAEDQLSLFKRDNSVVVAQNKGNIAARMLEQLSAESASIRMQRMILESQKPLLNNASDDLILAALGAQYMPQSATVVPAAGQNTEQAAGEVREGGLSPEKLLEIGSIGEGDWVSLTREKARLNYLLLSARENYRDSHPKVRELINKLKDIEEAMDREVQFALRKYQSDLDALNLNEQAFARAESAWMVEALETERIFDQYNNIKRDVERMRNLYDMVFSRLKEVDISQGIEPDTVRQIERAVPNNNPITPRKIQSIFLSALIGIGIGIGLVFGLEFLDDSIKYPEEISKSLGLSFLGVIPAASWNPGDIRTHLLSQIDAKSGLAEAYRNVRASLLMIDQQRKIKTILVTSSVPREGKTTTSLNLAISLAQAGLRVLLVDADMRRGEIHKFFGLEGGRGLSDVLSGQTKTESVIQRTGVTNLDMIATGPFPINPAELILRNEFRSFVEYAKRSYDKIIFDGPPVMAVSEASVLSSLIDSTVMVVWAGKTSRKICQITVQNLQQRGAHIDGCILNNLEFGRVGYYYYSTYYSYYNYDYRYDEKQRGT